MLVLCLQVVVLVGWRGQCSRQVVVVVPVMLLLDVQVVRQEAEADDMNASNSMDESSPRMSPAMNRDA